MSQPSYAQLMSAARQADAQGNTEDAKRLLELASQSRQSQGQPQRPDVGPPLSEPSFMESYANFGRGITQGAVRVGRLAKEGLIRGGNAVGLASDGWTEDALSRLNADREKSRLANFRYQEQSPWAYGGGEFVGETLATLPAGGVGGVAGRGAVQAGSYAVRGVGATGAKKLGLATMLGEGAAVGAVMSGGEDVLENAAFGALTDATVGTALQVTKPLGEAARRVVNTRSARREVDDLLQPMARRIDEAQEYGGFDMDTATAASTRRSLRDLDDLANSEEFSPQIEEFRVRQNEQIKARADQLVETFNGSRYTPEQTADVVRKTLTIQRLKDQRAWKNLYREFDRLAEQTDTRIYTGGLGPRMAELRAENLNSANEALINKIEKDLRRYGVPVAAPSGSSSGTGLSLGQRPLPDDGVQKPLSLENLENLIQDINSLWSPGLNDGEKRIIATYKSSVESYVDEALEQVGGKLSNGAENVVSAARAARAARRSFSERWTSSDIINKLTERIPRRGVSNEWAVDYTLSLSKLSPQDLSRVKTRLLETPGVGDGVWQSLRQAPVLDAMEQALARTSEQVLPNGQVVFNAKAFERVINKIDPRTRERLWGKEYDENLKRTIEAWKTAYARSSGKGIINTSETAYTLLRNFRFLPSGGSRNIAMAGSGVAPAVGRALTKDSRQRAVNDLLQGNKVPDSTYQEMVADYLQDFETRFQGAGGRRFGDMLRQLTRVGSIVVTYEDD